MPRKVTKRTGGPTYTDKLCATNRILEVQENELLQVQLQAQQLQCKEMVMVDMVKHQQILAAVLQKGAQLEQELAGDPGKPHLNGERCQIDANGTDSAASASSYANMASDKRCPQSPSPSCPHSHRVAPNYRPFAQLTGDSTVIQYFRSATYAMLQKIKIMTKEDWVTYLRQVIPIYTVLVQVLSHATEDDWTQAEQFEQAMQSGQKSTQASTVAPTPAQEPQSIPAAPAQQPVCPATDGRASSNDPYPLMSAYPDNHVPGACLAQDILILDKLVREMKLIMLLAGIFNPLPVYGACSINLVTGEPSVPRPAVRRQVASKLLLTKQQAQQLAVSLAEFERGSSLTNNQGANLVQEAADAGVLVALLARQNLNDDKAEHRAAGNHDDAAVTAVPAQVLVAASAEQRARPQAALAGGTSSAVPAQHSKSEVDEADQAGEAVEQHSLDNKLRRHMLARQLQHMAQHMLLGNTLTPLQMAAHVSASYPSGPMTTTVVEAVQMRLHETTGNDEEIMLAQRGLYWVYLQKKFDQQRLSQLQEQQRLWWQELAALAEQE